MGSAGLEGRGAIRGATSALKLENLLWIQCFCNGSVSMLVVYVCADRECMVVLAGDP
jgi:hypothetical protein